MMIDDYPQPDSERQRMLLKKLCQETFKNLRKTSQKHKRMVKESIKTLTGGDK